MRIFKFGGTSVGSPAQMRRVAEIINTPDSKVVVLLSAVAGTTNSLVKLNQLHADGNNKAIKEFLGELRTIYMDFIDALYEHL